MSPPAVIIRLELEAAPKVVADYLSQSDESRMADWLDAHPEVLDLIDRALDLAQQERAA